MSALKPPIQNRPGAAPASRRTAINRSPELVPNFRIFRQECDIRVSRLAVRAVRATQGREEDLEILPLRVEPSAGLDVFRRITRRNASAASSDHASYAMGIRS